MEKLTILVVDDELRMRQLVRDTLAGEDYALRLSGDSREAARLLVEHKFDIVVTDLMMPHLNGIEILEKARESNPDCMVILVTGYGTVESAVEAIRKGAYDYIQKPFEPDQLLLVVQRAAAHGRLLKENRMLRRQVEGCGADDLIGDSPQMQALKSYIAQVAPFETTVLIQGETGTGKELIAKLIHRWGQRADRPFLPVNCGALSETLLESELFGHVQGAFTGADRDKRGLFEAVDQGTIFLDEIDSTTAGFQVNLLRILQDGSYLKVGGQQPSRVDVRVIAASSRPLEEEVEAGRFRRDLLYRLNVVTVDIPPLRRRRKDIALLAHHFMAKYSCKYQKPVQSISAPVMARLRGYSWPGNVRELENVIERAVIMASGPELVANDVQTLSSPDMPADSGETGVLSLAAMEKIMITRALESTGGHRGKSAELLGISPVSLWRKIKKYDLAR